MGKRPLELRGVGPTSLIVREQRGRGGGGGFQMNDEKAPHFLVCRGFHGVRPAQTPQRNSICSNLTSLLSGWTWFSLQR